MLRAARLEEVIVTKHLRGDGTENSMKRIVTQFWSKEGEMLAEEDPCNPLLYDDLSGEFKNVNFGLNAGK